MAAATNASHQDKKQPKTSKKMRMLWVRKTNSATKQTSPSLPTNVQHKRAEPQEPTWRRVTLKITPQTIEPQESALKDKGKGKLVDVTNIASSSTFMSFLPRTPITTWVIRPKVDT